MQGIRPIPEDLIQCWEDYRFMHLYKEFQHRIASNLHKERKKWSPERTDAQVLAPSLCTIHALQARLNGEWQAMLEACRKLLLQSPHLLRIFQARRLLISDGWDPTDNISGELVQIHIILGLSWDNIRECICSLRPLIVQESDFFYTLFLFLPTLCWELDSLYPAAMVSRDWARGLIRLMQRIGNGDLPLRFW
jgi:hypothetical protein